MWAEEFGRKVAGSLRVQGQFKTPCHCARTTERLRTNAAAVFNDDTLVMKQSSFDLDYRLPSQGQSTFAISNTKSNPSVDLNPYDDYPYEISYTSRTAYTSTVLYSNLKVGTAHKLGEVELLASPDRGLLATEKLPYTMNNFDSLIFKNDLKHIYGKRIKMKDLKTYESVDPLINVPDPKRSLPLYQASAKHFGPDSKPYIAFRTKGESVHFTPPTPPGKGWRADYPGDDASYLIPFPSSRLYQGSTKLTAPDFKQYGHKKTDHSDWGVYYGPDIPEDKVQIAHDSGRANYVLGRSIHFWSGDQAKKPDVFLCVFDDKLPEPERFDSYLNYWGLRWRHSQIVVDYKDDGKFDGYDATEYNTCITVPGQRYQLLGQANTTTNFELEDVYETENLLQYAV
jgi:hypothetical protein